MANMWAAQADSSASSRSRWKAEVGALPGEAPVAPDAFAWKSCRAGIGAVIGPASLS